MPRGVGWFATHEWPEGQGKVQAKRKAADEPETPTNDDDDTGKIPCPNCDGNDGGCDRCGGTGMIDNPNPDAKSDEDVEEKNEMEALKALNAWDAAVRNRRQRTGESLAIASLRVGEERPDLYSAVQEEHADAVLTAKSRRLYVDALRARLGAHGAGTIQHIHTSNLPMR